MRSPCFEPDSLPGKAEFLVTKLFPSSLQGKITHLRKGERSNGREPCIMTSHRLAENQRSQKINACDKRKTSSQIRHQDKSSGYLATPMQEPHRILVVEVVKRQRTKRDVVCFSGVRLENVGFAVGNLRIIGAQSLGDFQCGRLVI